MTITQTGPTTITAGAIASYQVTITNDGPSDSSGVTLAETFTPDINAWMAGLFQNSGLAIRFLGGGAFIYTLAVGEAAAFTASVMVVRGVPLGGILTATATATASDIDPDFTNNTAQTSTTVEAEQPSSIAVPAGVGSSAGPVATPSPIDGFGRTIHTTLAGFSGVVAQFIDPTPNATSPAAPHFRVSINWGDGGLSVGMVTYDKMNGRWNVSGSHRYKKNGVYTITVIVQDSAGRQGSIASHAIVWPALVTPLTKKLV